MEEIKVGNHIRTKKGEIYKIKDINMYGTVKFIDDLNHTISKGINYYATNGREINKDDIIAQSKNLKDLVKAGDVIRYKLKNLKHENLIEVKEYKDMKTGEKYLGVEGFYLEQIEILEILTKETFARESYKVVEE